MKLSHITMLHMSQAHVLSIFERMLESDKFIVPTAKDNLHFGIRTAQEMLGVCELTWLQQTMLKRWIQLATELLEQPKP